MNEGSCVGLDVHARSVVAGVIDLGSPVRVVYEAGPTGYGLARACEGAGIGCVVAAPSKIRPAADRVKTDRRDAERLARLLRLGEITAVRVPGPEEEASRDLVRAREDARGDLPVTGSRSCSCVMGRCTTRPRGRGPTTRGFAGSGSKAGRSRSCSTSATPACWTRRPGGTRSTRRSPSLQRASRTSMSSSGSSVSVASPRSQRSR